MDERAKSLNHSTVDVRDFSPPTVETNLNRCIFGLYHVAIPTDVSLLSLSRSSYGHFLLDTLGAPDTPF